MADRKIESFEQFWDFYVGEHKDPANRALHFLGTTAATACLAGGLLTKRRWLLLVAPVVGYGPAWVGHFFIEKNKPASFSYPLWSLRADYKMWWKIATRTMQAEVDRVVREEEERNAKASGESPETASSAPKEASGADRPRESGGVVN